MGSIFNILLNNVVSGPCTDPFPFGDDPFHSAVPAAAWELLLANAPLSFVHLLRSLYNMDTFCQQATWTLGIFHDL